MKTTKSKPVMLNGIKIGDAERKDQIPGIVYAFAGELFGPLFSDGRNLGAVRFAAIGHFFASMGSEWQDDHAIARAATESPKAFYYEIGRPAEVSRSAAAG